MKAIPLKTGAGHRIYVEVEENFAPEVVRSPKGGSIASKTKAVEIVGDLEGVGDAIADVCKTLQEKIDKALGATKPNELTLEFGVKLAGEAGLPLVTKGSVEGTFKVSAKWNFAKPANPDNKG